MGYGGGALRLELESAIRDLLLLGPSPGALCEKIGLRLKEHGGQRAERRAFLNFLIQSGDFKTAYELIGQWMPDKERIPWNEFLFLLKNSGYRPNKEFLDYFFKAMEDVSPKDAVLVFHGWNEIDSRFLELEKNFLKTLSKDSSDRLQLLFNKLDYFKTHRMIDEEQRLIEDLLLRFPENEKLQKDLQTFKSRWAHHLVAEKARNLTEDNWLASALKPKPEEWDFGNHLLIVMKESVRLNQARAYDFAIGFYLMELYHHAIEMIALAPENLATDWFRLEVLLKARRFLECLEMINFVETKYASDPETTFAATYLRSQVLYGLGQTYPAKELLRSIVHIRPNYRSASSLLAGWEITR